MILSLNIFNSKIFLTHYQFDFVYLTQMKQYVKLYQYQ